MIRPLAVLSAAASLLLAASAWAQSPQAWADPAGYLRDAVATACALEDPGAEAAGRDLKAALVEDRSLGAGANRRYRFASGDELVLIRAEPDGLLRRFVAELHQRQPDGNLRPLAMAMAGSDCRVFHGRLIRYDPGGLALEIALLGRDMAAGGAVEPLNPPVPAGADPGGVAVALFDSGIDYTQPSVAPRLARDAEGRVLGYDFWDLDERPFDSHPVASPFFPARHGTSVASVLIHEAPEARLLPFRYPRPAMDRMADMVEAARAGGAVVVSLPMGSNKASDWGAFETAARARPEMLFVVSAGNNGRDIDQAPVYPAALDLDNLLVVTSAEDEGRLAGGANWGAEAVDLMVPAENLPVVDFSGGPNTGSGSSFAVPRVAALAARLLAEHPDWRAPELKAAILERAEPSPAPGPAPTRHGWIPDPTR